MVKRPTPREQALSDGMRSFPDRRGERAVECCLKRKGAYYHHLAGTSGNWRAAGPRTQVFGPGIPYQLDSDPACPFPRRPSLSLASVLHR